MDYTEGDGFFECVSLIHEAARISLPDLTEIAKNLDWTGSSERTELARIFLLAALVLLLVLSLDRAGQNGWTR